MSRTVTIHVQLIALALAVAACGLAPTAGPPSGGNSSTPAVSASPAGSPLAPAALRFALLDQLGPVRFCDPDQFPVGRDETVAMREKWPQIAADSAYAIIAARLGIDPAAEPAEPQRLTIYRSWKVLNSIALQPQGDRFAFDITTLPIEGEPAAHIVGMIGSDGGVEVTRREPAGPQECPICLARGSRIATPTGEVAVESIRVGTIVWTQDAEGRRRAAPVVRIGRTATPAAHEIIRLRLADGRTLEASPGHPLRDGRRVADVRRGDRVDGSVVVAAARRPYGIDETFDLLPAGETGVYWANGILVGSTLR